MSNLSELLPAGSGGKSVDFVASGTLPNGKPVILNSDGTVSVVAVSSTTLPTSIPAGSEAVFNAAYFYSISASLDPNTAGKFVVAYQDGGNSYYGTAIVGTVSGTSISFGSEYVFNSAQSDYTSVSFDPNTAGKFVVAYRDVGNSSYGTAIVGTVSGTSISYGSEYVFNSTLSYDISMSFDPNTAGKFVVAYRSVSGPTGTCKAIVGTVSGTSLSYGSATTFNSDHAYYISASFDPNTAGKFVVAYRDAGNSQYGTAIVGTVSGTSVSFGSEYVFNASQSDYISAAFDPNNANKFVVAYRDLGNSNYGTSIVGTVSGTSISYGSEAVFNSGSSYYTSISFDPNTTGKFVVAYDDDANSDYGTAIVGTVSGTSISFGSEYVFNSGSTDYTSVSFDPNAAGKFVVAYRDVGNSGYGTAIVGQIAATVSATNLTSTNFIGISDAAIADTASGSVTVKGGVSANLTSLTIGTDYYVQPAGTLATSAGTPSVLAGKAISATSLILKG